MAGTWEFNKADPSDVRIEVTQREQFNNDSVRLNEALVREVIQNSSDASAGDDPVKVRFTLKVLGDREAKELARYFESLIPHLRACGVRDPGHITETTRVLCIEDYNTVGLTGSFEKIDNDHFDKFWRTMGESQKSGQKGGRWGLGKLVYSSASQIHSFFGLTLRDGDDHPSIMGQSVLKNHSIDEDRYQVHGFWFDGKRNRFQSPVRNTDEVQKLQRIFGSRRVEQPGLSVMIPYLMESITENDLIEGVLKNFYFPILDGKLDVEVGDKLLNADTFLNVAKSVGRNVVDIPFSFVGQISSAIKLNNPIEMSQPISDERFDESYLSDDQCKEMRDIYSSGHLLHFRTPVSLRPKDRSRVTGHIHFFIRAIPEQEKRFSLFVRGPIMLHEERRHFTGAAQGAMIALDDPVAEFLGDAENPAHTTWNASAGKLSDRWYNAQKTLHVLRHALEDLYRIVAEQQEMEDEDVLASFFSLVDETKGSRRGRKAIRRAPDIPSRETAIRIEPRKGGFSLRAGPGAEKWTFPSRIRIRMAFDMVGSDPFKQFSPFDFDVTKKDDPVMFASKGGNVERRRPNVLYFDVNHPNFELNASGFDIRRDLVVDARLIR